MTPQITTTNNPFMEALHRGDARRHRAHAGLLRELDRDAFLVANPTTNAPTRTAALYRVLVQCCLLADTIAGAPDVYDLGKAVARWRCVDTDDRCSATAGTVYFNTLAAVARVPTPYPDLRYVRSLLGRLLRQRSSNELSALHDACERLNDVLDSGKPEQVRIAARALAQTWIAPSISGLAS